MERKLTTILAADVVGYSALMEADEAGTHERLRASRKDLFEPAIAHHHGRVFKLMGDGLLAEFGSVVDAVECAVSLQRGLAERNAHAPDGQRFQMRIGINLGEVIVEGDDRYGEGVNIAARLEQLAEPGGICVSAKVAREVEKKLAFGFESMGAQKVKNIAEPVDAYRVNLQDVKAAGAGVAPSSKPRLRPLALTLAAATLVLIAAIYGFTQWSGTSGPPLPDRPSIAVLPFENLSDDPQQAFFADGMAEDLMTDLSRLSGLFVIARNSSFAYRGKAMDLRQVARELGVRHILEGSVQRVGTQVRINIQLIDGATGAHQWAERYDGTHADIFALQDRVTKAVVEALAVQLTGAEKAVLGQRDTAVPAAYDAFLRGWEHYRLTTPEDYKKAIPFFEQAIKLDPDYGRAHAALAMVYFRSFEQRLSGGLGMSTDAAFRKARDHYNLAKVRPTSTSHQVAGNISRERGWYDDALKEFEAAIALDPSDSLSYADQAYTMIWAGRSAEAEAVIEKAMRLDPLFPPIFLFYQGLAEFAQDRFEQAEKTLEEAVKQNPGLPLPRLYLASTYGHRGKVDELVAMVREYNAARVRQGDTPFAMLELRPSLSSDALKVPENAKLTAGLAPAKIPLDYDAVDFESWKLNTAEIDALVFGHRLHGRYIATGLEHGASVAADGTALLHGNWGKGSAMARVDGARLCFDMTTTSTCGPILRIPGGTRAMENEYMWFTPWWHTFSQVD